MSARDLKEEVAWANEQIREEKAKLEKNGKNFFRIHTRKTRLKKKFMNI